MYVDQLVRTGFSYTTDKSDIRHDEMGLITQAEHDRLEKIVPLYELSIKLCGTSLLSLSSFFLKIAPCVLMDHESLLFWAYKRSFKCLYDEDNKELGLQLCTNQKHTSIWWIMKTERTWSGWKCLTSMISTAKARFV